MGPLENKVDYDLLASQTGAGTASSKVQGRGNGMGQYGAAISAGYMTLNQLIDKINRGEKIPDDIDPKLYEQLTAAAKNNKELQSKIDNAIISGAMSVPGIGTIVGGVYAASSLVGKAVAQEDEYGIAKSKGHAVMGAFNNPFGGIGESLQDGFQLSDVGSVLTPGAGGLAKYNRATERKKKAEIATSNMKRSKYANEMADYQNSLRESTMLPDSKNYANGGKVKKYAQGGKVTGPGTAKSDDISTSLKENSFVVPTENSEIAMQIGRRLLGWDDSQHAQKGGPAQVNLSDGEVVFQPDEVARLSSMGINVNDLAPNASIAGNNFADGGWVDAMSKSVMKNEGFKNKIYNDTLGHKTIGVGLMLEKKDGTRNKAAIDAIKSLGYTDADIEKILIGEIELTDEQVQKSYGNYIEQTLVPELKRHFGSDWNDMDDKARSVAADLMYNQGASNFKKDRWKNVSDNLRKNDVVQALDSIDTDPALKVWREQTGSRNERIRAHIESFESNAGNAPATGPGSGIVPSQAGPVAPNTPTGNNLEGMLNQTARNTKPSPKPLENQRSYSEIDKELDKIINEKNQPRKEGEKKEKKDDKKAVYYGMPNVGDNDKNGVNRRKELIAELDQEGISELQKLKALRKIDIAFPDIDLEEIPETDAYNREDILNKAEKKGGEGEVDLNLKPTLQTKTDAQYEKEMADLQRQQINDMEVTPKEKNGVNMPSWLNAGNLLSAGQIGMGLNGLLKQGDRPEDSIGSDYTGFINELRNAEPIGYTAQQYEVATTEIENARLNELNAIKNMVGGDAGLAMASIQESGNRVNKQLGQVAFQDASIMAQDRNSIRNQRANAEFFYEKRREKINNDHMVEFDKNQAAYANLLNAGIANMIGNNDPLYRKYQDEYKQKV